MAPINKNLADMYAVYLRKSRTDLELEAMGEGETLARHHNMLMNLAAKHEIHPDQLVIYKELVSGDSEAIMETMRELNARRKEKQPLEYPSAGSTFKRCEGHYTAQMIDQAGLKGYQVGGAAISTKHAGFAVNLGGATAADVGALIRRVQQAVEEKSGVLLQPEVRIW